jgi:hypothetical protein
VLAFLALSSLAHASYDRPFHDAIARVEAMVSDPVVRATAARAGLDVVNVTWEDTGRFKGSAVGPNISDMTIGVRDAAGRLHPMPVLRFDNFTDHTADIDADSFWLRVGNERGAVSRSLNLTDFLRNPRAHLSDPRSWPGGASSLWASRDREVLVSAQACLLPIPRAGEATFTPVLYNYQSSPGDPAVLAIVATREGTSAQVIENDAGYLSQPLFFNDAGERAPFVAERLSDWVAEGQGPMPASPTDAGLDVVLVIQVPLLQRHPQRLGDGWGPPAPPSMASGLEMDRQRGVDDTEAAVVGHGDVEGPFREMDGIPIERDPRFPVRVTVQFYQATSTGVVSEASIRAMRRQIDRVYADAAYVGSLVVDGYTGRSTEWTDWPEPSPPPDPATATWADPFWTWHRAQ